MKKRIRECVASFWYPRQESNLYLEFRKPSFYPLNYGDAGSGRSGLAAKVALTGRVGKFGFSMSLWCRQNPGMVTIPQGKRDLHPGRKMLCSEWVEKYLSIVRPADWVESNPELL